MGYCDTQSLPIYQYLTSEGRPKCAVLNNFFQAAFGGSFLNHQWLISAQTPVYPSPLPPREHAPLDHRRRRLALELPAAPVDRSARRRAHGGAQPRRLHAPAPARVR